MSLVSLLFGFKGRINRAQFWMGNLGAGLGAIMLMFLLGAMFMPTGEIPKAGAGALQAVSAVVIVLGAPLLLISWIGSALQTKRFHDRDRSGLWTMLPLIPGFMIASTLVATLASGQTPDQAISAIGAWMLIMQAINLFLFVDLGCMPGKSQPNKYGPPPGGGLSRGAPSDKPVPGQRIPDTASSPNPGIGLASAESAIERAIAAREKQPQASAPQTPTQKLGAKPIAMAPMRVGARGSFGRKATS
ncbi:MAG: DUF805 domain-containing protein [Hyphomonadaceae bacterium]|nr:DUF805 domain-containing protein [Hyphomonadaceae bacterium]